MAEAGFALGVIQEATKGLLEVCVDSVSCLSVGREARAEGARGILVFVFVIEVLVGEVAGGIRAAAVGLGVAGRGPGQD